MNTINDMDVNELYDEILDLNTIVRINRQENNAEYRMIYQALCLINGYRLVKHVFNTERVIWKNLMQVNTEDTVININPLSVIIVINLMNNFQRFSKPTSKGVVYMDRIIDTVIEYCPQTVIDKLSETISYLSSITVEELNKLKSVSQFITGVKHVHIKPNGFVIALSPQKLSYISQEHSIYKDMNVNISNLMLKNGLFDILANRVNIHKCNIDKNGIKEYSDDIIKFGFSLILKLVLLSWNKISIESLYMHSEYKLVLGVTKELKLNYVKVPGVQIPSVYSDTNIVASRQAKWGIVSVNKLSNISGYYEQLGTEWIARDSTNKLVARYEKMDSNNSGWNIPKSVKFLVIDLPSDHPLVNWFSTAPIYMCSEYIKQYGVCRLISNMSEGCIKGVTSWTGFLDKELDSDNINIIGANSLKAGLASLFSNIKSLNDIIINFDELNTDNFEVFDIAGYEVKGIIKSFNIKISNAYTAEQYVYVDETNKYSNQMEDVIDQGSKLINKYEEEGLEEETSFVGLRTRLMDLCVQEDIPLYEVINANKHAESIIHMSETPRGRLTNFIASELQSMKYWYGEEVVTSLIHSLTKSKLNKHNSSKIYAIQWLKGIKDIDIVKTVTLDKLVSIYQDYKDNDEFITSTISHPKDMILDIINYMGGFGNKSGWIKLDLGYGLYSYIPANSIFHQHIDKDINDWDTLINISGLLETVIETITSSINTSNGKLIDSKEALLIKQTTLNMKIESILLGKELGRLYTKGKYMVMLPHPGLKSDEVVIINRDNYLPKFLHDHKYVLCNIGKMPTLFNGATAGFKCYKDFNHVEGFDPLSPINTNTDITMMFSNCVFMSVEAILEMVNDTDGDLSRVTFDKYILPMYSSRSLKEFNGSFFSKSVINECKGLKLTAKLPKTLIPSEIHSEIESAIIAKDNVAIYSSMKYGYEYAMASISQLKNKVTNEIITYSDQDKLEYSLLLGEFVQVFGMNAIKQTTLKGDITNIADVLNPYGFARCKTAADLKERGKIAVDLLYAYIKSNGYGKDKDWCYKMVKFFICIYQYITKNENKLIYNLYQQRYTDNIQNPSRYSLLQVGGKNILDNSVNDISKILLVSLINEIEGEEC